jgi:hypothetical protein
VYFWKWHNSILRGFQCHILRWRCSKWNWGLLCVSHLNREANICVDGLGWLLSKQLNHLRFMNHVKDIFWIFSNAPIWLMQNPHQLLAVRTLTLDIGVSMTDPTTYHAILGSLQYLSLTQPNICFTVNKLSQFMHKPTDIHWQIVKRCLCYL